MKLTPHDLKQMNEEWLDKLDLDQMSVVSKKLLSDLKEAHDRLNQSPKNSSRPSGSQEPWKSGDSKNDATNGDKDKEGDKEPSRSEGNEKRDSGNNGTGKEKEPKKKAGKQVGGKGFGRTQKLSIHKIEHHYCN